MGSDSLSDDNDQFYIKEVEHDDTDEEEKLSNSSANKSKKKSSNNISCKYDTSYINNLLMII